MTAREYPYTPTKGRSKGKTFNRPEDYWAEVRRLRTILGPSRRVGITNGRPTGARPSPDRFTLRATYKGQPFSLEGPVNRDPVTAFPAVMAMLAGADQRDVIIPQPSLTHGGEGFEPHPRGRG